MRSAKKKKKTHHMPSLNFHYLNKTLSISFIQKLTHCLYASPLLVEDPSSFAPFLFPSDVLVHYLWTCGNKRTVVIQKSDKRVQLLKIVHICKWHKNNTNIIQPLIPTSINLPWTDIHHQIFLSLFLCHNRCFAYQFHIILTRNECTRLSPS